MQTNILGTEPVWVLPIMCPPTLDYRLHWNGVYLLHTFLVSKQEVTLIPEDGVTGRNVIRPKEQPDQLFMPNLKSWSRGVRQLLT